MKAKIIDNHVVITDGKESICLDMNETHQQVHLWITLHDGGQSLMTLKFTENGIQVRK
jgi:hypothetical protein